jgi:hypothetical protein
MVTETDSARPSAIGVCTMVGPVASTACTVKVMNVAGAALGSFATFEELSVASM